MKSLLKREDVKFIAVIGSLLLFAFFILANLNSDGNEIDGVKFVVIEIDGCEYLKYDGAYDSCAITHKGNCKYCNQKGGN